MTREEAARILGVPVDASHEEVIKAWKTLAQQVHPDRGGTNGMFDLLTEAKDTLENPQEPHESSTWHSMFGGYGDASPDVRDEGEVGDTWDTAIKSGYGSGGGEKLVFGMPWGEYVSQVLGRAFSLRLIVASFFTGILIAVIVGTFWDAAGDVVGIPAAILVWLGYAVNPTSPPPKCPYCRKRVKLSAKACHHCGRTVVMEVDGF